MTETATAVRLGPLPGGTLARAMLVLALLSAPAAGIGWWQVAAGGQESFGELNLGVVMAASGTLAVALALLLFVLARRTRAGGRIDAGGLQVGSRRLAWSEVSRFGLRAVPGGRDVLVAYPKDDSGAVFVGSLTTGQREHLLGQIEQLSGRRIERE